MDRREFLAASTMAVGAAKLAAPASAGTFTRPSQGSTAKAPGELKHSLCRWCYSGIPLDELCAKVKPLGYASIELLGEKEWPIVAAHGLQCAVANGPTKIGDGLNNPANHAAFAVQCERLIPLVKEAGIPNLIVFSGNRGAVSDDDGLANCATALQMVTPIAEDQGVTIVMELLNSKVDHHGYMCDRTPWGVELVKRVGSDRFRLLYDIYHMQVMEGDVIRTMTDNLWAIAHFHTGGVPGRAEIDDSQELNYPAICRALVASGYSGFFAQEFIPRRDPIASLSDAIARCSVV